MAEPLIHVEELSVSYGSTAALRDVSFQVQPSQIVAVVGPNGAGKTTLFKTLFGEQSRDSGDVKICGLDPSSRRGAKRLWSVARWVTDRPLLYDELTVREFLQFSARCFGVPEPSIEPASLDIAMNLGLSDHLKKRIKTLSFGMQRKVHIAAGFFSGASGPRVLVMDEPTVGLDPPARQLLAQVLERYVNAGSLDSERAILVSSHNLAELSSIATVVVMLNEGRVVAAGPIRELAAATSEALNYELMLFEDRAHELSAALLKEFDVATDVLGERSMTLQCPNPQTLEQILRFITESNPPFRLRELKEELTSLERVFLQRMGEEVVE